ncbi:hypothetical protein J2TS6_48700 [Paenibacillus albilobatus]|uniref:Uncharacterized protein n=1 Tax=Paenibacillus albilobatus TaxID=2716884 RepID=A0A920CEA8_9BACL|nr:hypothetical protein [Paenibacillus albilobatus]GIO33729.1 hypothetical protein J2TS6_48700 [Paenibacillus albilobatus]
MKRKRKLFYNKVDGAAIQTVDGDIIYGSDLKETTIEEAFRDYKSLAERVPETVGLLELEYDDYLQDFKEGVWTGVDLDTMKPLFYYPNPNDPAPEQPVYQPPLTEQVKELRERQDATEAAILALMDVTVMG